MIQKTPTCEITKSYEDIVQSMRELYNGDITDQEAHEAARNIIGFYRTLLAILNEREQNSA
jgi:hypothetical protein